jgi:helicase
MSYDAYRSQILKYLIDAGGRALRNKIQKETGIPKASMTDVMKKMVSEGLIKVLPTFGNNTYWEITLQGKKVYQYGKGPIPDYSLPPIVEDYLEKKPNFSGFRPIQDTFIRRGLLTSKHNVSVFGPPASGKTLIAEMTMIRELQKGGRVLYATPYKALDRQKFKDFQTFSKLGYPVLITDGDNPLSQETLKKAPVVIATYERAFGAISAGEKWLDNVSLVCADELTLLSEDRGATIDSLLTVLMTDTPSNPRIITLSSHVGNKFKIAEWLQAEPVIEDVYHDIEEFVVYEDDGHVVLWNKNGESKRIPNDKSVIEYLVGQNIAKEETTLVFVNTRWEAQAVARQLKDLHEKMGSNTIEAKIQRCFDKLDEETPLVKELCELLKSGVAFHHAGLPMEMRNLIEDLLQERQIRTVVCTTTLSHGIDYPVDNVIVFLSGLKNRWELDSYVCIQLEGRAGRPGKSQADSILGKGRAYLITTKDDATRCMEKYIFGKPEAVMPNTFSEENLARLILVLTSGSRGQNKNVEDITNSINSTLGATNVSNGKVSTSSVERIILELQKQGMLKRQNGKLIITELGEFMNTINVSPSDARLIINVLENPRTWKSRSRKARSEKKEEISDFGLLHLACCTDVTKNMRVVGPSANLPFSMEIIQTTIVDPSAMDKKDFVESLLKALVLMDWIEEKPLGEISGCYPGYDDHDVHQLGMYASRSLAKTSKIAERLKLDVLSDRAEVLSMRCKFGVKTDLAQSKLVFLKGIGRVRGRRLLESGFTIEKLAHPTQKLASVLNDSELRRSVIEQSQEITRNENG